MKILKALQLDCNAFVLIQKIPATLSKNEVRKTDIADITVVQTTS